MSLRDIQAVRSEDAAQVDQVSPKSCEDAAQGCSRFNNRVLEELPTTELEVISAPILETIAAPRRCKTDYNRHA
ncbi:hypothetical protein L3X38_018068 [Prunus dulcis]|uniref:Uncharacterized protein n=1 Tax=Prunus dulcis TaxID=3755 RepID=A0AAD4ZAN8_PRUDU|nr:hypothetical protein L3X38_018068 [Prunus dulcis]